MCSCLLNTPSAFAHKNLATPPPLWGDGPERVIQKNRGYAVFFEKIQHYHFYYHQLLYSQFTHRHISGGPISAFDEKVKDEFHSTS